MRYIKKPDSLESELVIGTIKQIDIGESKRCLTIEDEDGDVHKVDVHHDLLRSVESGITGSKVICGTRCGTTFEGSHPPPFVDIFEILHFLDGSKAGETLQYCWKNA